MSNLIQTARELKERTEAEVVCDCSVCGSPVIHHQSKEGTQSYERFLSFGDLQGLVYALIEAEEVIKAYHKIFPVDELPSTWLKKYSEGE